MYRYICMCEYKISVGIDRKLILVISRKCIGFRKGPILCLLNSVTIICICYIFNGWQTWNFSFLFLLEPLAHRKWDCISQSRGLETGQPGAPSSQIRPEVEHIIATQKFLKKITERTKCNRDWAAVGKGITFPYSRGAKIHLGTPVLLLRCCGNTARAAASHCPSRPPYLFLL